MLSLAKTMTTMSEHSHLHRTIIRSSHEVLLRVHLHRAARRLFLGAFCSSSFPSSSLQAFFPTLHSLGWETFPFSNSRF